MPDAQPAAAAVALIATAAISADLIGAAGLAASVCPGRIRQLHSRISDRPARACRNGRC
jgi:hypothetical protein